MVSDHLTTWRRVRGPAAIAANCNAVRFSPTPHGSCPAVLLRDPDRNGLTGHIEQDFDVQIAALRAAQPACQAGEGKAPAPGADQGRHVQRALEITAGRAGNPGIFPATPHPDAPTGIIRIPQSLDPGHAQLGYCDENKVGT